MKQRKTKYIQTKAYEKTKNKFKEIVTAKGYTESSALTILIMRVINGEIKL